MYRTIFTPVDLEHIEKLDKSLETAASLAKTYGAQLIFASVAAATPSAIARTPEQFEEKLKEFAAAQSSKHGIATSAKAIVSHDPTIDLDDKLLAAVRETGADLVVMQSHVPHLSDALWPSNGGTIATHAAVSVLLVR